MLLLKQGQPGGEEEGSFVTPNKNKREGASVTPAVHQTRIDSGVELATVTAQRSSLVCVLLKRFP
jgi:hypothetical protein